jgi:class 3 adenylate cyclase
VGSPDDNDAESGAPGETASSEKNRETADIKRSWRDSKPPGRFRQFCMGAVVVATCLITVLAATSYWVHETLLDTQKYVATVKPIARDPAVTKAMSQWMSEQLLEVVNAEKIIRDALPEGGRLLAAPLASAVRTFVQDQIDKILQSSAFEKAWAVANTAAHTTAVRVLRDETGTNVVSTSNGKVVLNLLPLFNEALRQLQNASPDILGHEVTLPEIKADQIPTDARQRISDAIGVKLPGDFGEIVLFDSSQLRTAQDVVRWFDRANVALLILAPLALAFTIWVSHRRRRTVMQLGVGIAIGLVLIRRGSIIGKDSVLNKVNDKINRNAFDAAISHVLGSYLSFTGWLIFLALLVAAIAFLTGPSSRAEHMRQGTRRLLRDAASGLAKAGTEHEDDPILRWVRTNSVFLQVGAAVAIVLAMLLFDLSWPTLILLFLVLASFEFIIYFLSAGVRSRTVSLQVPADASGELEPVPVGELGPGQSTPDPADDRGEEDGAG